MSDAVSVEPVSFERDGQPCAGLLARPASSEPAAAVVLMPAIAGINDYIQRVAYSLAATGFVCFSPDYYVREGQAPDLSTREAITRAVAALPDPRVGDDLRRAIAYLREKPFVRQSSIGVLGFCIGGTYALFAGVDQPELGCVIDFYGQLRYGERTPEKPRCPLDVAGEVGCPVLAHYGDRDHLVAADDVAELQARLADRQAEVYVYPGAGHAFHEDFRPAVYRPVAATEAWRRTVLYLDWHLRRDQVQVG